MKNLNLNAAMIMSVSALLMCLSHNVYAYPNKIYLCHKSNGTPSYSNVECPNAKTLLVAEQAAKIPALDLGLRPYEKVLLERSHQLRMLETYNKSKINLIISYK